MHILPNSFWEWIVFCALGICFLWRWRKHRKEVEDQFWRDLPRLVREAEEEYDRMH